jgi:hypothetical protein
MKPEDLTIEDLEKAIDLPSDKWHGKCTLVAHAAQKIVGGHDVYGDYLGPIDPDGYWGHRRGFSNHHGWVLLDDDRILDPTRWSFENIEPYIYLEHNKKDYDEGSNRMRSQLMGQCPPPEGKKANLKFAPSAKMLFEKLTGTSPEELTVNQIHWVANIPYEQLDFAMHSVYQTIINSNMSAFIPIDNVRRAKREGRIDD